MTITIHHYATRLNGGAGIAAERIFESQRRDQELNAKMLSFDSKGKIEEYIKINKEKIGNSLKHIFLRFLYRGIYRVTKINDEKYENFTQSFFSHSVKPYSSDPDIVHIHWIGSGFIDFKYFFNQLPSDIPIIITLHDMNNFTGGCHYSWGCKKFQNMCVDCPQIHKNVFFDPARKSFVNKKKSLQGRNVHIVGDSFWITEEAKKSNILENALSFQTIHYGLDTKIYKPHDREAAKKSLGIPVNSFVICFAAVKLKSERKGFSYLRDAVELLLKENIHKDLVCISFGSGGEDIPGVENINFGDIQNAKLQRIVYSCADVFVIPSIYEAFGQTCLEAMACGTPVVGFRTGGIPDMIKEGYNGYLAIWKSAVSLKDKLLKVIQLNSTQYEALSVNARDMVKKDFLPEDKNQMYKKLYFKALQKNSY